MIECLVYSLLTIFIPLKMSYEAVKHKSETDTRMWAVYWAFYTLFKSITYNLSFLDITPVNFLFLLFALWLYHQDYRGALYMSDTLVSVISKNSQAAKVLNQIADKAQFLGLFESNPVIKDKTE